MEWYYIILIIMGTIATIGLLVYLIYYRIPLRYGRKIINAISALHYLKQINENHTHISTYDPQYYNYMSTTLKNLGITYTLYRAIPNSTVTVLQITSDVMGVIYSYDHGMEYFHKKLIPLYNEIIKIVSDIEDMKTAENEAKYNSKENKINEYMKGFDSKVFKVHRKLQS